jgi:hypothetical protein
MKELFYYFIFAIILYFVLTYVFDNFNLEQENFDPSLVPVSSIVTLAKVAQKLVNGNGTLTNPGSLQIGTSATAPGNLTVTGNTSVGGTLGVTGNTTVNGSLNVNNVSAFESHSRFNRGITISRDGAVISGGIVVLEGRTTLMGLTVNGNTSVNGTFGVTGNTSVNGSFGVTGATTVDGNTTVNGTFKATATGNTISASDRVILYGDNGNINAYGKLTLTGTSGSSTIGGGLTVTGDSSVSGTLSAGATTLSSATVNGALSAGATTLSSATVSGAFTVNGATTLSSATVSGALSAGATTLSSATITGDSTVSGTLNLSTSTWHKSTDGSKRLHFGTNDSTFIGTKKHHVWRNKNDTDMMILDENNNLTVKGYSASTAILITVSTWSGKAFLEAAKPYFRATDPDGKMLWFVFTLDTNAHTNFGPIIKMYGNQIWRYDVFINNSGTCSGCSARPANGNDDFRAII